MGRRQRLLQAYKRSAVRTVVLTIMFLSVAQWLLHSQPRKAAPSSIPEHNAHFIVVTTQRSGSRWLVDELRRAAAFLGFPVDDSDAEFGKMDTNGDGKASFEEFAQWWNASDARLHRHFALDPGGKKRTQSNTSGAFLG